MPCSAKWQGNALNFALLKILEASVLFGYVSLVTNQKEFGEKELHWFDKP